VVGVGDAQLAAVYMGSAQGLATTPALSLTVSDGGSFGDAVACAGDVDGDGYADLLVSSRGAERVYLFRGGAGGLASSPATVLSDGISVNEGDFGISVAGAGVVDGD